MSTWETEIFHGEFAQNVRSEYRKLLSVNISDAEAEMLVVNHFMENISPGHILEGRLWLALALCEWQLGRLSHNVKYKAQQWSAYPWEDISNVCIGSLLSTLDSPMPPRKRIRMPSHISHCPWPVGSLLAYRIISSEHPNVTGSPFYKKYVLLRVIMIKRHPVTNLAPDAGWNESMLVGLYDWVGGAIPDPHIVDNLRFTPIHIESPVLSPTVFQNMLNTHKSFTVDDILLQAIGKATEPRVETCCSLDWKCAKGTRTDEVFTYLGCNALFPESERFFFKTGVLDYSLCHCKSFDAVLVNRLTKLQTEKGKDNI